MPRPSILLLSAFALTFTLAGALSARGEAGELHRIPPAASAKQAIQVYKSPTCGCCSAWVEHIKAAGFEVQVVDVTDQELQARKSRLGVGPNLASCHTALVNGYVVEGHVPAADIKRMLAEKPAIAGIAAPGMPTGSPGMEVPGQRAEKYDVVSFTKGGATKVFAHH